jgi:two-component system sensor histidine kinase QseC
VSALDGLFGRIEGLLDAERRFTADAAHELRTPIAAIRAQAQVALGEADDARRRHALQSALQGCDRAARVVEQLLTLARLDAGLEAARSPVDMAALARRVTADMAAAAIGRGQSLELEADGDCVVPGDETLLAVLLRNLVDNALRYSHADSRVLVRLRHAQDRVMLSVDDSGAGLDAQQLARLGERFFRARPEDGEGSGLGWSIAQRIASAHGARLSAMRSSELGGMRVQASFGALAAAATAEHR